MGAANALAAYRRWSGRVPPTSLMLLVYMAIVSKDKDEWPWYGQGQEALAEFALGRENPDTTDVRAVTRAMTPLLEAGAVTVERAASNRNDNNSTARYRLNLTDRADAEREAWEQSPAGQRRVADTRRKGKPQDGNRRMATPVEDASHTTVSGQVIRRNSANHTTVCDEPYDGNRRTKEEEEEEERENRGIGVEETTTSHPSRATTPPTIAPVVQLFPGIADEPTAPTGPPPYEPPVPWSRRDFGLNNLSEASARIAAKRAARQAELAADNATEVS